MNKPLPADCERLRVQLKKKEDALTKRRLQIGLVESLNDPTCKKMETQFKRLNDKIRSQQTRKRP